MTEVRLLRKQPSDLDLREIVINDTKPDQELANALSPRETSKVCPT